MISFIVFSGMKLFTQALFYGSLATDVKEWMSNHILDIAIKAYLRDVFYYLQKSEKAW